MARSSRSRDVKKVYAGGVEAVKGVSFDVPDGHFCVLVGPSGCGKSTLLRMLAGVETISSGEVRIGDRVVNDVEPSERDIAMVFQNYALYPHMRVYDNMAYGLRNRKMPKDEIDKRVREAARILEIDALLDRKPRELSGGQRQRVAMGRAIVRQPKVFLFDEPLSNLDAKLRVSMRVEIKKLQKQLGTTSIYVTHDQLEAMTLADMLVVMNGGQVEQIGAPLEIYQKPATTFVATFIGAPAMNLLKMSGAEPALLLGNASIPRWRHRRHPPRGPRAEQRRHAARGHGRAAARRQWRSSGSVRKASSMARSIAATTSSFACRAPLRRRPASGRRRSRHGQSCMSSAPTAAGDCSQSPDFSGKIPFLNP